MFIACRINGPQPLKITPDWIEGGCATLCLLIPECMLKSGAFLKGGMVKRLSPCLPWSGKCVVVADGDTIRVMHTGKAEKIRLYGTDCPERGQDFGTHARKFTSDMLFGKMVDLEPVDRDRHSRMALSIFQEEQILYL